MRRKAVVAVALAMGAGACGVQAKEGGDQYPNGAESWYAGALPPPGTYFINYLGYYSGTLKDGDGNTANPALLGGREGKVSAWFDALRLVHVTGVKLLGGDYALHAIVPIVRQNLDLGGEQKVSGLGDITFSPFVIGWHHSKELHSIFAVDFYLDAGKYDEGRSAAGDPRHNIGTNYRSIEPVYAVSYLGASGWEASAKLMYNIKRRNPTTDYKSGNEFHMDFLVGKHMGPWGVGAAGYYVKQTSDDKVGGTSVAAVPGLWSQGRRGEAWALGPSVKYTTKGGMHLIATWNNEFHVRNRFEGDKVWFKLILPL